MTGSRKPISGIILSNSCDIDAANVKAFPRNILFAPITKLGKYVEKLRADGKTQDQIDGILTTIRKQRVTNIFYLPLAPTLQKKASYRWTTYMRIPYWIFWPEIGSHFLN